MSSSILQAETVVKSVKTGADGKYEIWGIDEGFYDIKAVKAGYENGTSTNEQVVRGLSTEVNLKMKVKTTSVEEAFAANVFWIFLLLAAMVITLILVGIAVGRRKKKKQASPIGAKPYEDANALRNYLAQQQPYPDGGGMQYPAQQPMQAGGGGGAVGAVAQPMPLTEPAPVTQTQPAQGPEMQTPVSETQPTAQAQPQMQAQPSYVASPAVAAAGSQSGNVKVCKRCGFVNEKWRLSCIKCKSNLGGL